MSARATCNSPHSSLSIPELVDRGLTPEQIAGVLGAPVEDLAEYVARKRIRPTPTQEAS